MSCCSMSAGCVNKQLFANIFFCQVTSNCSCIYNIYLCNVAEQYKYKVTWNRKIQVKYKYLKPVLRTKYCNWVNARSYFLPLYDSGLRNIRIYLWLWLVFKMIPVTNVLNSDTSEKWRSSCRVGVRGLVGIGGTWQDAVGFVSPMLGNRMCSREVMERPEGEGPLIYTLWTWLRPGSRPSNLLMGPIGRRGDVTKTITPEVTRRHSLPLSFSRLCWFLSFSFSQSLCPRPLKLFYPLCPPPNTLNIEL